MKSTLFIFLSFLTIFPTYSTAQTEFEDLFSTTLDIQVLEIKKKPFFAFIHKTVQEKEKGLGTYGKLNIDFCKFTFKGRPLNAYQTSKGRDVRFLSNPSCHQMVLQKVLTLNYKYDPDNRSSYDNRKCIRYIEDLTAPLYEFYTLKFELTPQGNCTFCESKERARVQKIIKIRRKIKETCDSKSVFSFISDLEQAFTRALKK